MKRILIVSATSAVATGRLWAQPIDGGFNVGQAPTQSRDWSDIEIYLSVGLLVFALIVMLLQCVYLWHRGKEWSAEAVTRFIGFPLVISAALLLVVAGYSDTQVAPVFALLGAIAGYLFGKSGENSTSKGPSA